MTDVVTLMLSVIIEATPFLIIGTFIAMLVQKYGFFDKAIKRLPRNPVLRRPIIACLGVLLPVCECGNIPLTRSLMRKGFSVGEATTFMLAAPIINPITFFTTREAFRGVPWVAPARMLGGLFIALLVGWGIGLFGKAVLTKDFADSCEVTTTAKKGSFSISFAKEFWAMFKLLCLGALIAGVTQLVISQESIASLVGNQFAGVGIMLALGFVISICSSVDAFFALAYAGTVSYGALVTFMVAGPMVDIKSMAMLKTTYTARALVGIALSVGILSAAIGVVLSYVG